MSLFEELKRRNVFRVGTAYVVAAWVLIEVSSLILDIYEYPDSVMKLLVAFLALGLPFVLFFAWAFEVTPEGVKREKDVLRSEGQSRDTAKRLDLVTITLLVAAIGLLVLGRFSLDQESDALSGDEVVSFGFDNEEIAQRMIEINRLKNEGDHPAAFAQASDLVSAVPGTSFDDAFWDDISLIADIRTEPAGARVYLQGVDADADDWEELGTTPLSGVRFARGEGYRLRLELDGYRPVDFLHSAVTGYAVVGLLPIDPIVLDPVDSLPEEMVRIRGFTQDLVDYEDFYIDRFEVTNRAYQKFVDAGGYETDTLWLEPFVDGEEQVPFAEAMQRFVDRTGRAGPSGWSGGVYPSGQGEYPVGGISWYEAVAYSEFVGKQLPTVAHIWQAHEFLRLDSWLESPRSNLESDGPRPVGDNRAMSTTGVYDLIGNVREWCWNDSGNQQKCTTGAAWPDASYHAGWIIPKSPWDRDATNGFRLVRTFDDVAKIERLGQRADPEFRRDFRSETPATDAEFAIYKRLYDYDEAPLNAEVLWEREYDDWVRQRVAFDVPYGERGGAFIFLPRGREISRGTIVVWSGGGLLSMQDEFEEYWTSAYDFLIRSGYAVVMPIFKGSYDRDDENFSITYGSVIDNSAGTAYRDIQIKWLQDLSRTIDYLETRDDIDSERLGFAGHSWGGQTAPIVLALEERFDAAVLNVGGLWEYFEFLPEADPINFVTRVRVPVLMMNGEFDIVFPFETSQLPLYELLGTDPGDKKHVVTADAHKVSQEILIRESLDWFEKYLN